MIKATRSPNAPVVGVASGLLANRPWAAIALLMLIGVFNYLDRILPTILAEPIKHDLNLSDTTIGLIYGFGFLVIYAVAGIPLAKIADRGRYGLVIGGSLALWSAMTALGGMAQTGWQLAAARMGVALGEAGSTPAAHAYITRNLPPQQRAAGLAFLTLSVPIGAMAALVGGGMLSEALGWRGAFFAMGVCGLLLSPLALLALGLGRPLPVSAQRIEGRTGPGLLHLFRKRSFVWLLAGSALIAVGGYSTTTFGPAFLIRVHELSVRDAGMQLGISAGVAGVAGLLLTGWLADRLARRDARWLVGVVALMVGALVPFSIAAFLVPGTTAAIACLALNQVIVTAYLAPVVAALHRLAPLELRARTSAILLFGSAIFGSAGPLLVGMVSDALAPAHGPASLGLALLLAPAAFTLAAACYVAALRHFRADLEPDAA